MNKRIRELAAQAGIDPESDTLCRYEGWSEPIERFAALVAAAERDRCILILERLHERSGGQYNYYLHAAKVLKGEV